MDVGSRIPFKERLVLASKQALLGLFECDWRSWRESQNGLRCIKERYLRRGRITGSAGRREQEVRSRDTGRGEPGERARSGVEPREQWRHTLPAGRGLRVCRGHYKPSKKKMSYLSPARRLLAMQCCCASSRNAASQTKCPDAVCGKSRDRG